MSDKLIGTCPECGAPTEDAGEWADRSPRIRYVPPAFVRYISGITGRAAVPSDALRQAFVEGANCVRCATNCCGWATNARIEAEATRYVAGQSSADISEVSRHRAEGDHAVVATDSAVGAAAVRPADGIASELARIHRDLTENATPLDWPPGVQYWDLYDFADEGAVQPDAPLAADDYAICMCRYGWQRGAVRLLEWNPACPTHAGGLLPDGAQPQQESPK